jgi:hypothetical protein
MARIVRGTGIVFPELKQIQSLLKDYSKSIRRKYMKAAFNATAKVGMDALRRITPRGPTGNLKKAVVRKATQGYGLAGYAAGGRKGQEDKKGYHQGFLEFGTKDRRTKGRIASTFGSKTPGRGGRMTIKTPGRGNNAGRLSTSSPKYPKSFFKSAKAGQTVSLKKMPVGGRTGAPPVKTAFNSSRSQITTTLQKQMSTVLERANADMARRARTG